MNADIIHQKQLKSRVRERNDRKHLFWKSSRIDVFLTGGEIHVEQNKSSKDARD